MGLVESKIETMVDLNSGLPALLIVPDGGPVGVGCEIFDFSPKDDDVDLLDFATFQEAFD